MKVYYTLRKHASSFVGDFPCCEEDNENASAYYDYKNGKGYIKYWNARLLNLDALSSRDLKQENMERWKWWAVSDSTFKLYLNFLKTGHQKHLIQAERSLL